MTWKEMVLTAYHREGMILLSILWNADQMSGVGSVILGQGSHNVGQSLNPSHCSASRYW